MGSAEYTWASWRGVNSHIRQHGCECSICLGRCQIGHALARSGFTSFPSMKNLFKTNVALAAMSFAASGYAQGLEPPILAEVFVTANPIVEDNTVDPYSSFSTTVTTAQVKDLAALDLADTLRMTPGVQISRYDSVGSYNGNQGGAIYIRGMGASRPGAEIKTYVDGVPFYMGVWNHPLLDLLPVSAMQSVVINKGPQPQVNGNNFASINLETKRAQEDGVHGEAQVAVGSYSTWVTQASLQGKQSDTDYSLALGRTASNGHLPNADANLMSAVGHIGQRLDAHWSMAAGFLAVSNEAGDPLNASPPARDQSNAHMLNFSLRHVHGDWSGEIKLYDNQGRNDLLNDATWGNFNTNFSMSGLRWKEELSPWKQGKLVLGLDNDRISGKISGPWVGGGAPWTQATNGSTSLPTVATSSPYVSLSQTIDLSRQWIAQPSAGLRLYSSNHWASRTAPFAGLSLVSDKTTFYVNYTEGVLYPGLETFALPLAIPFMFAGNTNASQLALSVDKHKEVGAKMTVGPSTQVDLSLFKDDVSNRYVWSAPTGPGSGTFTNGFSDYNLTGLELSVRHNLTEFWKFFGGLTALKSSSSGLPYVPSTAWSMGLSGRVGTTKVSFDVQHQAGMYAMSLDRSAATTNQWVNGFTVANARVAYAIPRLGKSGEVFVALKNLFNANYQYNPGYVMPGRNGIIGLVASF